MKLRRNAPGSIISAATATRAATGGSGSGAARSGAAGGVAAWLAPWRARWLALGERERRLLVLMALVLGLAVLWLVAVQPAWRTLRSAPAEIDRLAAELLRMRALAAESQALRGAPKIGLQQAGNALQAATARLGEHGKLQRIGDRATLTLSEADGDALRRWLDEARSGARARPVEATLSRGVRGYNGTLVLQLPAGEP